MQRDQSSPLPSAGEHHWPDQDRVQRGHTGPIGGHTNATMTTDALLLQAFRTGDEAAFTTLAERYHRAIHAACQRQAPADEVDDCVQAVFLVLARRPAAAGRAPVLLAWLHRVAHFVCRDARRAAARRRHTMTIAPQPASTGHAPEAAVLERLDAALLGLEERQRVAVMLHAAGSATDDIAQSLGVTTANASKLIQRGLAGLRERLCRQGAPVSAALLLGLCAGTSANAATPPITVASLSAATNHASLLAKGTLMHLTLTAPSTWIIAASMVASVGLGGVMAVEALSPPAIVPPTAEHQAPDEVWRQELNNRLEMRLTLDLKKMDFQDVLTLLRQLSEISMVVAPEVVLADVPSITLTAKNQRLREVLDAIMKKADLRYELRNGALVIGTNPKDNAGVLPPQARNDNPRVTFHASDMNYELLIASLSKLADTPITIDPQLGRHAKVSVNFKDMDLTEALASIARVTGGEVKVLPGNPPGYQIVARATPEEREPVPPSAVQ